MKHISYICLMAMIACGCADKLSEVEEVCSPTSITATIEAVLPSAAEDNRAVLNSEGKKVIWSPDDKIGVGTSAGTLQSYKISKGEGTENAVFVGSLPTGTTINGKVVFPYNAETAFKDNTLTLNMPNKYTYSNESSILGDYANSSGMPMYASYNSSGLTFKHLGGYFVFEIDKIPVGATSFVFKETGGQDITGKFTVDLSASVPTYHTEDGFGDNSTVTIKFRTTTAVCKKLFYVPVPVGSYTFEWSIYKGTELAAFGEIATPVTVNRGDVKIVRRECSSVSTATNVPFEDAIFKAYMVGKYDTDKDGEISMEEAQKVYQIICSSKGITSLAGIEYCVNLTLLYCDHNELTTLDVSNLKKLEYLLCDYNQITTLDVSNHVYLKTLKCSYNQLTTLNASGCSALEVFDCDNNQLVSLNVGGCTAMKHLVCDYNKLETLNTSGCSSLTYLSCRNNLLTELNASGCNALSTLYCHNNQLASLDVSSFKYLTDLTCGNNLLTSINVSGCTYLKKLSCHDNQLETLNVSGLSALTDLDLQNNKFTTLNVSGLSALSSLNCFDNPIKKIIISPSQSTSGWAYPSGTIITTSNDEENDEVDIAQTIVGAWAQDGDKAIFQFTSDGKLVLYDTRQEYNQNKPYEYRGETWSYKNDLLTYTVDGDPTPLYCRVEKVQGDQIVWRDYDDGDAYLNPGAEYIYQDKYGVYRLWTWTRIGD